MQLANRDLDGSVIEPLYEALLLRAGYDVSAPVLRDGRGLLEYVRDASFPHQRSRERLLERLQEIASAAVE
ncbi:hypothetical protein ACFWHR_10035 [Leucobacter sp. NPDC058333]|uniref:hypothetical protein n=1 Tax=Leucobacter sp. NPDC058333 TaxID=3346450 RepID=UPI00364874B2